MRDDKGPPPDDETRPIARVERTSVPSWIGPYHLLERLGSGGMGDVWLAEQREPIHRQVAVKLIRQSFSSPELEARFALERQALALTQHPNIARVLDAGATAEGRPYFVMELVS